MINKTVKDAMLTTLTYSVLSITILFATSAVADQLTYRFKSPSFSGIGAGAHYLTIENQERSRREKIKDDIESALSQAERDADNSTINKFIRNLESRIYSQISKGLVDGMFCDPAVVVACTNSDSGAFTIEGNAVSYQRVFSEDGVELIRMTIVGTDGTVTEIEIPIGIGNIGT